MPTTIAERITEATVKLETDTSLLHSIVHGPASGDGSIVTTDGGPVKTAARVLAEIKAEAAVAIPKSASFTAEAGKHYSVDTDNAVVTPEAPPSGSTGQIVFTSLSQSNSGYTYLNLVEDHDVPYGVDEGGGVALYFWAGNAVVQNAIDYLNANFGYMFTFSLAEGVSGLDLLYGGYAETGSSSPGSIDYTEVVVTIPAPTGSRVLIEMSDARGSWGANPLRLSPASGLINGIAGVKQVRTPALLITLVDVGAPDGWRIYSGASVPDNIALPILSGASTEYSTLTCTQGTWTNAATDFSFQWQISADGTTGWADIEGATNATFSVRVGDLAKFLRCGVVATSSAGDSSQEFSAPTGAITEMTFETGILAYWKLSDLTDASGNGNTLTNDNGVTFGTGKIGNAAQFDGTNWLLREPLWEHIPSAPLPFSCSVWVNPASLSTNRVITNFSNAWMVELGDTYTMLALVGGTFQTVTVSAIPTDSWTHLTVTFSDPTLTLYINGVEAVSLIRDGDFAGIEEDLANFCIGAQAGGFRCFNGKIDEIGVWGRTLAPAEITALYNAGAGLELF